MRKKVLSYIVFLDTNILRSNTFNENLTQFINTYRQNNKIKISVFLPETVLGEYKSFLLGKIEKAIGHYNKGRNFLQTLIGFKTKKPKFSKRQLESSLDKFLRKNHLKVIKTPYSRINLKTLLRKAIYHEPPFESAGEKGFKDEIIARTILTNLWRLSKKGEVVFICGDKNLREYIISLGRNLKVYESIPDFESEVKLRLEEINDKLIEEITRQAELAFLNPEDKKSSLYFKFNIEQQTKDKFPSLFSRPQLNETFGILLPVDRKRKWKPITKGKFEVSKPVFVQKKKNTYFWESTVVYRQQFEDIGTQNVLTPALASHLTYILEFKVRWQSEISDDGRVFNPDIIDIEHTSTRTTSFPESFPNVSAPASTATISGQGTTPVEG